MSHVINGRALTGEKPCINKTIHALLMLGYATFSMLVPGPKNIVAVTRCVLPGPRKSIVHGNCIRETSVKRLRNLICSYRGQRIVSVTRCVLPGPRTSIVHGNCVRETSVKRRNKIVQEIKRNVANVFSLFFVFLLFFFAIIAIEHGFSMH